jgi:UDP-glucose:(heptosyl)LPS alpha-1,3-glucosyltransferase
MNFEIKRLELVLKAVAELLAKQKESAKLKVLVVGKGEKEKYHLMARQLEIADRVIFAGVTREVEKYYLASDIFAMPSAFDTFGLAVLEAMAAGLPVIITRTVGARDLIDPGVHGFVLSKNPSPTDFTTVLDILMERETRMKMGQNSMQTALKHDWDTVANKVANIYLSHGNNTGLR